MLTLLATSAVTALALVLLILAAALSQPSLAPPWIWTTNIPLNNGPENHTTTLLSSGKVPGDGGI